MGLRFEHMVEYLENAGYNLDGMHADEVDVLAEAENFKFIDSTGKYHYQN